MPDVHPDKMVHTIYRLRGEVAQVFPEDGSIALYLDAIPGLMSAIMPPDTMEFLVDNREQLKGLRPGQRVTGYVSRRGRDFILFDLKPAPVPPAQEKRGQNTGSLAHSIVRDMEAWRLGEFVRPREFIAAVGGLGVESTAAVV